MQSRRAIVGLLLLAAWRVPPASAQARSCLRRTIPVNVVGQGGFPVKGLTAGDFTASLHGQPVRLLSATLDTGPRHVVVLLDAGMVGRAAEAREKWELAISIAQDLVQRMPPANEIALGGFSAKAAKEMDFTPNRQALFDDLAKLARLPRRPGLGMWGKRGGLWSAIRMSPMLFRPLGRGDVVYVITDGVGAERGAPARAAGELARAGVRLFAFVIPPLPFDSVVSRGTEELNAQARDTGGLAIGPSDLDWNCPPVTGDVPCTLPGSGVPLNLPEREQANTWLAGKNGKRSLLGALLDAQYAQVGAFYWLEIELLEPLRMAREWNLKLTGPRDVLQEHGRLVYPRMLLPCSAGGPP
jgi:hypothetical protein